MCDAGEKWREKTSASCLMTHLLQSTEDHGDLVCVEESLRHQRQAGLCVPLKFIVTVVILNRSDLEPRTETGRCHVKSRCGASTERQDIKLVVTRVSP